MAAIRSYGSFPLSVQLVIGLRLFAQLLFSESDVRIHQASSNTARQKAIVRERKEGRTRDICNGEKSDKS